MLGYEDASIAGFTGSFCRGRPRGFARLDTDRAAVRGAWRAAVSAGLAFVVDGIRSVPFARAGVRESEARKSAMLEVALDCIITSDHEGRIIDWNPAAERTFGYSRSEALGRQMAELIIPPSRRESHLQGIARYLETGEGPVLGKRIEMPAMRADGTEFPAELAISVIKGKQHPMFTAYLRDLTERKRSERALRESEERFRMVVESVMDYAFIMLDAGGHVLSWNAGAERIKGYPADEIVGQHFSRFYPKEDVASGKPERKLAAATAKGRIEEEGWRVRKDGSQFMAHVVMTALRDDAGQLRGFAKVTRDITERKHAQTVLEESEQRLNLALESSHIGTWSWDLSGNTIIWDDYIHSLFGLKPKTFAGHRENFFNLVHADDRERIRQELALSVEKGAPYHTEYRVVWPDGSVHWLASHGTVYRGEGTRPPHMVGACWDITERKHIEQRLHEQADIISRAHDAIIGQDFASDLIKVWSTGAERLYDIEQRLQEQADIINRAHDAIVVRDFASDVIKVWNTGAERLYGWSASEAIGRSIAELIYADPREREGPLEILNATGEFRGELKQVTKDGREVIVDARATIMRNPDGTPRSVLIIDTDITEQKKLEMQLLRAQRLESIGTLASGVAHDLNNVLAPILLSAEMLRGGKSNRDPASLISLIEDCARRGAAIVRQVLTFARGIEGERVVINPLHLIHEMIEIAKATFPKTIEITGRYPENLWTIKGDPTQLHQVLLNLAVNARDAMPDGGSIVIGAENLEVNDHDASMTPGATSGPHVVLSVSDTGRGMSRAVIDNIFDPFFTTKEIGKGTGLGLSTTLGIVKSHGGFISLQSEIGRGTTFKICLPAEMNEGIARLAEMSFESLNGNGELILVVDDEPGILLITQMILEKHNYRVLLANDGPEALAIIAQEKQPINAVLTDISMPHMDGVALIRAIKKMKPGMTFIASTGQEETLGAELQALAVSRFLAKPYDIPTLLTIVRDTLRGAPGDLRTGGA